MVLPKIKAQHLPKGWVPTTIGDILEFEYGKGLPKKDRNEDGEYPVYGSNGIVGYHDNFLIESPALIIGRKGAAGEVSFSEKNCWPIDTTYFIRNFKLLSINFVYYLLKTVKLTQLDKSTAIPGLNRNDAYRVKINIPPLPEQHRIVAKIEELFSQLDSGISSLKKAQAQLKIYRQAVLKYAFEGKLTEEWRKQHQPEPAETLLEQIKVEQDNWIIQEIKLGNSEAKRLKNKLKKNKLVIPDNIKIPAEWKWSTLLKACHFVVDCHNKTAPYEKNGIYLVRTSNIRNGLLNLTNDIKFVSKETYKFWSRRCFPEPDDILFTREAPMGEAAIIPSKIKLCMGQRMMLLRVFFQYLTPKYLLYNLLNSAFHRQFTKNAIGTGVKHLRVGDVEKLVFPVCSYEEQHAIVQEIESRLSVCDKLEQDIETNLQKAEALRQSILKKAFEGRLVPQNPNDEPAEKLLERIQLEKAELEAKNKAAKAKKRKPKRSKKNTP